jgi:hypothetical protein
MFLSRRRPIAELVCKRIVSTARRAISVRRGITDDPLAPPVTPPGSWSPRRLQSARERVGEAVAMIPTPASSEERKRILECADAIDVALYALMAQIELTGRSKSEVAAAALYLVQERVQDLLDRGLKVPLVNSSFPRG